MALQPQQFCVRWNSYHTNLQAVFPRLLLTEQFADVTLACESRQLRCHKLVLSACSAYLERLLLQNPCDHPIVLMRDMRFSEMQALVDFMYKGEVNVTQEELPSLLKSAEALQIRGLCSNDSSGLAPDANKPESKDFTVASEALVANAQRTSTVNGPSTQLPKPVIAQPVNTTNGTKKRKSEERAEVKEETVEEDGLFYGELDNDHLEYNEDEDTGKPGSSLGQPSGRRPAPFIRVKPESELFFQNKLQSLAKAYTEYINRLAKMNSAEIKNEFSKYGLNTNAAEDYLQQKSAEKAENDYYKSWLEQNGELEVSLLKANQIKKSKIEARSQKSEVELIPKSVANKEIYTKLGEKAQIRRRGRPPIFKDKNVDIGDTVLKSDLDQFLEGKEVSSSGLSRKDLERVMMGKFNPNRRYSNEAMWAALMDVKKGGSIYRAAQTHKVPRKSLRNWMKRCHIKSSFPMPQQLKQFVENSKKQKEYKNYEYPTTGEGQTYDKSGPETEPYEPDLDFGKHFLSFTNSTVSSEDEISKNEDKSTDNGENSAGAGVRTSTEIVTRHFIDMDNGIPLNIHARPRVVGRRPNAIVNIETDVFQEKSYKQYSSQHLRDALIAVKKGYSVYAASNKYGVPRKTLRNWMEKYDIKSQFSKDFAIANVQCQYDSLSDSEPDGIRSSSVGEDHTYGSRDEPPAFIIHHITSAPTQSSNLTSGEMMPKIMTIGPGYSPSVNVIHVGDQPQVSQSSQPNEYGISKRIRRSEVVLRQAADCVSRGLTFQTVSEQFKIPISTIRFFMARKGILPRRRRGRTTQVTRMCTSPEPPFHMQHYKLPDMVALKTDDDEPGNS